MRLHFSVKRFECFRRPLHLLIPQLLEAMVQPTGSTSFNLYRHIMPVVLLKTWFMNWMRITILGKIYPGRVPSEPCTIPTDDHLKVHRAKGMAQSVDNNLVVHAGNLP